MTKTHQIYYTNLRCVEAKLKVGKRLSGFRRKALSRSNKAKAKGENMAGKRVAASSSVQMYVHVFAYWVHRLMSRIWSMMDCVLL